MMVKKEVSAVSLLESREQCYVKATNSNNKKQEFSKPSGHAGSGCLLQGESHAAAGCSASVSQLAFPASGWNRREVVNAPPLPPTPPPISPPQSYQ